MFDGANKYRGLISGGRFGAVGCTYFHFFYWPMRSRKGKSRDVIQDWNAMMFIDSAALPGKYIK